MFKNHYISRDSSSIVNGIAVGFQLEGRRRKFAEGLEMIQQLKVASTMNFSPYFMVNLNSIKRLIHPKFIIEMAYFTAWKT